MGSDYLLSDVVPAGGIGVEARSLRPGETPCEVYVEGQVLGSMFVRTLNLSYE